LFDLIGDYVVQSIVSTLFCVLGLSMGQVAFKYAANSLNQTQSIFAPKTLIILIIALLIYGITTIAWIIILRSVELGKIYPIMALAYIFVPLASLIFFKERFSINYYLGVILIMIGIVVTFR